MTDAQLNVQIPADVTRLATIEHARNFITGISDTDTVAATIIGELLDVATARIRRYLGYEPSAQTYQLELLEPGSRVLLPVPVNQSVSGVQSGTRAISYYHVDQVLILREEPPDILTVTYDAGYPTTLTAVEVPPDLRHAALVLVNQFWQARGRSPDVVAQSIGGIGSFNYEQERMPIGVLDILDAYRWRQI